MRVVENYSRYSVDDNGNIYSNNYKNSGKTKVLKPALDASGYLKTMIQTDEGKYTTIAVHRFAAISFFGKSNGLEVNHKNGIKTDNSIGNLEYCTRSQNIKHAYDTGLIIPKRGSLNGMSKLTEQDVKEIRDYVANFEGRYYGRKALAEKYGVSEPHIKDIVSRRRDIWMSV